MIRKIILSASVLLVIFTGCSVSSQKEEKLRDVEYTVAAEEELPQEIMEAIEEKKENEFQLTYTTEEYLYVIKGYGEKPTGGYSVQVNEFYLTEENIVFKSELKGPKEGEKVNKEKSYPFIIIRTESIDRNVNFQ